MSYRRLTQMERYQIHSLLQSKISIRKISAILKRQPSTISREIHRGSQTLGSYDADFSEIQSQIKMCRSRPMLQKIKGRLRARVNKLIREDLSPEQIVSQLHTNQAPISYRTIYRYIKADRDNGGKLFKHLRILKKERKYTKPRWKPTRLEGRTMIEERPKKVEKRKEIGGQGRPFRLGRILADHQDQSGLSDQDQKGHRGQEQYSLHYL